MNKNNLVKIFVASELIIIRVSLTVRTNYLKRCSRLAIAIASHNKQVGGVA